MKRKYTASPYQVQKPLLDWRKLIQALGVSELRQRIECEACKVRYGKGQEVFPVGERIRYVYFVLSGKAKICRPTPQGGYIVTRLVGRGECFGLRSYFSTSQTSAVRAEAFDDLELYQLPVQVLEDLLGRNYEASRLVVTTLSDELERIEDRTNALLNKHMRGRMADCLLILLEQYGFRRDGRTLALDLKLKDLSELANMTIANASRTLSQFASEGIIIKHRRMVRLLSIPDLERISRSPY